MSKFEVCGVGRGRASGLAGIVRSVQPGDQAHQVVDAGDDGGLAYPNHNAYDCEVAPKCAPAYAAAAAARRMYTPSSFPSRPPRAAGR
jgi:hypothetical protein